METSCGDAAAGAWKLGRDRRSGVWSVEARSRLARRRLERESSVETGAPLRYYWERRSFPDGDDFYYFPHGGHVLLEPPPVVSGGLLADEMGYGKTITALALIAADLEKNPLKNEAGTLVVVPRSLYGQWAEEIKTKAPRLKCVSVNTKERKLTSAEALGTSVVLLRQDQLNDFNLKVPWRRIVVDESQSAR